MKLFRDHSKEEVTNSFLAFIFPGRAGEFVIDQSDPMGALINALACEIQRAYNSMNNFSEDYDILVTDELLTRWESALGIPDDCFLNTGSRAERRLNVLIKFAKMNVQTAEQMRALAVSLGFVDTTVSALSENALPPYNVPFIPNTTPDNRYVIQVTASGAVTNFPPYDVPFIPSSENQSLLACIFNIIKPANTQVVFSNVATSIFNPLSVTSSTGWYDGTDFDSMTMNLSGVISEWPNKSVGGANLTESTPSLRPIFVNSVVNGRGVVRFNNSNLQATTGGLLSLPTGDSTVMFVARKNNGTAAEFLISWSNSGDLQQFANYQDDFPAPLTQEVVDEDTVEDQFELITVVRNGTTLSVQVGSNAIVTNEEGSAGLTADLLQVGGFGTDYRFSGDIAEMAMFDDILSSGERTQMNTYFNTRFSL